VEKSLDRYCRIEYRVARISPRIHANRTGTEALPPGYDFNSNISHAETQSPQRILGVRGYEGWHRNRIGRIVPDSSGLLLSEKWPVSSAHSASPREQPQRSGSTAQHMITVTAGILSDGDRVLICQRRAGSQFPLKWEFPGGKIEEGESPEACLHRELSEELAIEAEVGPEMYRTEHRYPGGFAVRLLFFRILRSSGTPTNHAFERIEWVRQADLCAYDFLEADRELIERMAQGEIT